MNPSDLQEVKSDLKELRKDTSEIKEAVLMNTASLDYHIKRTDLNERRIESLEKWLLGFLASAVLAIVVRLLTH